MSVLILCPTRERPDGARATYQSAQDTTHGRAKVGFYIDRDDPCLSAYERLADLPNALVLIGDRVGPVASFNGLVYRFRDFDLFAGATDDMVYETQDWDLFVEDARHSFIHRVGIISPAHQLGEFCNFVTATTEWIEALGWIAVPSLYHFAWDTAAEVLGDATDSLIRNPPEYRVEHRYQRAHNMDRLNDDCLKFVMWCAQHRRNDIQRILKAQGR